MSSVPDFEILEDRIIEEGKFKKKKLVPAKWDLPYQRAKESLKKGNINKAPERLDTVDFSVWVNSKSLLYLEKKKHYFEKSPSLEKYKSDVGNTIIDGPEREEFLRMQVEKLK